MTQEKQEIEGFEGEEDEFEGEGGELLDSEYQGMGIVYIDRKGCIRCKHLVGELGKKTFGCNLNEGNMNCPAARYKIIIGMDVEKAVTDVVESVQKSDLDSVIQILTDVKEKDPAVVQDFMLELCDRLGVELEASSAEDDEEFESDSNITEEDDDITEEQTDDEIEEDDEE